ncbi:hypothetical protein [Eremococcus coleocola]|uniref:Uncharacterized protein n=1 Tax=Eremococcus coleocola ACS-139-V-Col8 TaxID=908337 RepID=E4KR15_9LACT|nr:hypothetical protein [Eremococcus coleocola]EFR30819.1 hypothetical protein HMPREF9257_0727 [Eremococcus coleocola ACS-139-V-Col8]
MIYVFLVIAIGVFAWVNYDLRRRGRQMEMDSSEDWYLQRSYFGRLLAKNKKENTRALREDRQSFQYDPYEDYQASEMNYQAYEAARKKRTQESQQDKS